MPCAPAIGTLGTREKDPGDCWWASLVPSQWALGLVRNSVSKTKKRMKSDWRRHRRLTYDLHTDVHTEIYWHADMEREKKGRRENLVIYITMSQTGDHRGCWKTTANGKERQSSHDPTHRSLPRSGEKGIPRGWGEAGQRVKTTCIVCLLVLFFWERVYGGLNRNGPIDS